MTPSSAPCRAAVAVAMFRDTVILYDEATPCTEHPISSTAVDLVGGVSRHSQSLPFHEAISGPEPLVKERSGAPGDSQFIGAAVHHIHLPVLVPGSIPRPSHPFVGDEGDAGDADPDITTPMGFKTAG